VSNDGNSEDEEEGDDSGHSQVLQSSDDEVIDVVTEEEDDEDGENEGGTKDEVWLSEKRHSGDGEVAAAFLSTFVLIFNNLVIN